ncbi:holin [Nonomuraea basaltis]|uniref:holin n=1 Tax=Nonomuraea basaltis TaxID=2495887 RepID=UPI00110C4530|nr:holin [Nonomuraea basaltis]TMR99501.1 holin [Nonomuraea basaltis]
MMHAEPVEYSKPLVERKVTASAAGSYLGLVAVLTVLQTVNADLDLIAFLPDWLESLTIPLLPGLITWVSGYKAKHTPRPDLPLDQR